jgi:cephalosporin-C deacetylase
VAGLAEGLVAAAQPDVPFLCSYRRAVDITPEGPYPEIADYLRWHSRDKVENAFRTLSYFDGVNFAKRATAPALFSVGLMDPVCPASTVYTAFHHYAGADKEMTVWQYGDHGGGHASNAQAQLLWLRNRGLASECLFSIMSWAFLSS